VADRCVGGWCGYRTTANDLCDDGSLAQRMLSSRSAKSCSHTAITRARIPFSRASTYSCTMNRRRSRCAAVNCSKVPNTPRPGLVLCNVEDVGVLVGVRRRLCHRFQAHHHSLEVAMHVGVILRPRRRRMVVQRGMLVNTWALVSQIRRAAGEPKGRA
jgi:hypothetical protein